MFLGLVPHGQPNGFGFRIGQANERPIGDSYGFTELLIYRVIVFSGSSVAESRYSRVYGDQSLRVTQSRVYAEKRLRITESIRVTESLCLFLCLFPVL